MNNDFDQTAILEKMWEDAVDVGITLRFFLIETITSSDLNPSILSTEDQFLPLGLDDIYHLVSKRIRDGIRPTNIQFKHKFKYRIIYKENRYDILVYAALTFPQLKRLAKKNVIRDLCDLRKILD